jgi:hypothetical protein
MLSAASASDSLATPFSRFSAGFFTLLLAD